MMKRLLPAALAALIATMPELRADDPFTDRDRAIAAAAQAAAPGGAAPAPADFLIVVDPALQRMTLWRDGAPLRAFTVSTAAAGLGNADGSGKTPTGWHRVAEWVGRDALPGQVFVSRVPTGEVLPPADWRSEADDDKVLTCILWLDGLEPGLNSGPGIDSHDRYIYIHGTNQEQLLGTPASHGCIRLSNRDVAELFHRTFGHKTLCFIAPH